jgi:glutamate/tyrosine decarboxylase-like PLP-dependent enzyme
MEEKMNFNELLKTTFIDPSGQNLNEVKKSIDSLNNLLLDHLASSANRTPLDITEQISISTDIPSSPRSLPSIKKELLEILSGSANTSHPKYIGHMDSIPTLMSIIGEFLSASLNNNMLSLEMSPVFSIMEERLIQQFCGLFHLEGKAGGVMVSGGTLANIQALCVARNKAFSSTKTSLNMNTTQPIILASESAHTSLQKAAMILGLGYSAVIPVKTNINSQMDIND